MAILYHLINTIHFCITITLFNLFMRFGLNLIQCNFHTLLIGRNISGEIDPGFKCVSYRVLNLLIIESITQ